MPPFLANNSRRPAAFFDLLGPSGAAAVKAGPSAEEVERMLRAVALKAAASLYAGHGTEAKELVLACAAEFLAWLKGAG